MECRGVPADSRPVALEREKHAIGDAQGGEHAPSGEQADLARRERRLGNFADVAVVKDVTMKHVPILPRWSTVARWFDAGE
jgi:hypothetical protein